jgi:DNA-binding transcriptional ArsR family regulator
MEELNDLFGALSDPTRRDILTRVATNDMSVGEIAGNYELTFAAIAKHIGVLERASLVTKRRNGKEQIVTIAPNALLSAQSYIETYTKLWETRLDSLDTYLQSVTK